MHPLVAKLLDQFPEIEAEDREQIGNALNIQDFKKGDVLLKEGEIPSVCHFVLQGCVRQYVMQEGEEKTIDFFTETFGVVASNHYAERSRSAYFLQCIEDSIVLLGNPAQDMEMYARFPILEQVTRKMLEQELTLTKKKMAYYLTSSPEQRYLEFQENRPDLINRIPLHQMASYLGVKPESLSRIRRRLTTK